jgi:hypothetical protein
VLWVARQQNYSQLLTAAVVYGVTDSVHAYVAVSMAAAIAACQCRTTNNVRIAARSHAAATAMHHHHHHHHQITKLSHSINAIGPAQCHKHVLPAAAAVLGPHALQTAAASCSNAYQLPSCLLLPTD